MEGRTFLDFCRPLMGRAGEDWLVWAWETVTGEESVAFEQTN